MAISVPTRPSPLFDAGWVLTGDVRVSLFLGLAILNGESAFLRLNRLTTNCADDGSRLSKEHRTTSREQSIGQPRCGVPPFEIRRVSPPSGSWKHGIELSRGFATSGSFVLLGLRRDFSSLTSPSGVRRAAQPRAR